MHERYPHHQVPSLGRDQAGNCCCRQGWRRSRLYQNLPKRSAANLRCDRKPRTSRERLRRVGSKGRSLIVGLHFVPKKRPGKPTLHYVYAWRGGPLIARREGGGKPVLTTAEVKAAIEAIERNATPDSKTLSALVREWERSPAWKNLAISTKKTWSSYIKQIVERWGQTPLSVWSDPRMKAKVVRWRDERAATPRGADLGVMVLRELLKFGRLHGRVLINVAEGIPTLYRNGQRAEIIWTDEDIDRFAFEARRMDKLHVLDGLRLCAVTGLRREDLVTVSRSDVSDFAIVKRALKNKSWSEADCIDAADTGTRSPAAGT